MHIRALIADDEPLARQTIRDLLETDEDFEIVGEAATGRETVSSVRRLRPDLLFLDIKMPDTDGVGLVEQGDSLELPPTIFVTAYDEFALKAFDVRAVDYLLKPFEETRFWSAVSRAKKQIECDEIFRKGQRVLDLLSDVSPGGRRSQRLAIKSGGGVIFVKTDEIDWVEADGNYLKVHVGDNTYSQRGTMKMLEDTLNKSQFVRIHKSAIVNVERIKELRPWPTGEYVVLLQNGKELTLSKSFRWVLKDILKT